MGRKLSKWALRAIGLFVAMIAYLAWKELSFKLGTEGAGMGALRGVAIWGAYLAFVFWTRSLDDDTQEDASGDSAAKLLTAAAVAMVLAIAWFLLKIASTRFNLDFGFLWGGVGLIAVAGGYAAILIFLVSAARKDLSGKSQKSTLDRVIWWIVGTLAFLVLILPPIIIGISEFTEYLG